MEIRIKKLDPNAVIPSKAHVNDAGFDLVAVSERVTRNYIEYGTGIAVEIPEGHAGYLFPRSSVSNKKLWLANSVGVIDSNYRGEIKFRFRHALGVSTKESDVYKPATGDYVGDRIGQLIILPLPEVTLIEVDELGDSERGDGGFGSSGQ